MFPHVASTDCRLSYRGEILINYPRFAGYDRLQSVSARYDTTEQTSYSQDHELFIHGPFSKVLSSQDASLEPLLEGQPAKETAPGSVLWRLNNRNKNATKAIFKLNNKTGADGPLQDFTNVLPEYPWQGRVDAMGSLRDGDFFSDLVKAFNGSKKRATTFLTAFRFFHVDPTNMDEVPPLYIPYLLVEYKKDVGENEQTAQNQRSLYCVAAARFLEAVGITDYMVYGASTSGSTVTLCAAWVSSKDSVSNRLKLSECDSVTTDNDITVVPYCLWWSG